MSTLDRHPTLSIGHQAFNRNRKCCSVGFRIAVNDSSFDNRVMGMEIGHVRAIFRYPIKSMAGQKLDNAMLGWHGVAGDRRFAIRRLVERGAFPWLTASRLPELLLYQPFGRQDTADETPPTHIRTPDGREYELSDEAWVREISTRHRGDVELMQIKHGIFDEAAVSVIGSATIECIAREVGHEPDLRRYRANLVIDTRGAQPFGEDDWVGKILEFGSDGTGPAISVTMRDPRCAMINLDPDSAEANATVMQTIIRLNDNFAGVYGTVVRAGELRVGQSVSLRA